MNILQHLSVYAKIKAEKFNRRKAKMTVEDLPTREQEESFRVKDKVAELVQRATTPKDTKELESRAIKDNEAIDDYRRAIAENDINTENILAATPHTKEQADEFNAIFIDIGGGTTDIAVVTNGGLEGTKMFAIGGRSYTKRLAQALNVPFGRAEEIKIAYSRDMLKEESKKIVRDALYADANVWRSGVELALSEFSNVELLPSRILLCGGGSALPEIKEVLTDSDWYKELPFAKKPQVHFIKPKDVVNIVDETGKLVDQQDITPMGLANLVVEIGEEDVLPSLMRKITKSMQG